MTCFSRIVIGMTFALFSLPALAEPTRWAIIDDWDVGFYPATRGCLAFARFDDTDFFIGFDTHERVPALDITVLDGRWDSIEQDSRYPISLVFGDRPPWTLDMLGVYMDGTPGLNILIDASMDRSETFVEEFQREPRMSWFYGDTELGKFTLRGSKRAFEEVQACQDAHQKEIQRMELEDEGVIVAADPQPAPATRIGPRPLPHHRNALATAPQPTRVAPLHTKPEPVSAQPLPQAKAAETPRGQSAKAISAQTLSPHLSPLEIETVNQIVATD